MTGSSATAAQQTEHRAAVHQYVALLFVTVFSFIGAFPFHLLSAFALGAALQFRQVSRPLRLAVGAISLVPLVAGVASAAVTL